jgi:hypothetical protein
MPDGLNLSCSADDWINFEKDDRARIPDGEYSAVLVYHHTSYIFRTPKVYLWFRIVNPGPFFETMLYRAYRVKSIKGKGKRNGGLTVGRSSDLKKDIVRLMGLKVRPERISLAELRSKQWRIRTRTVSRDYRQDALPAWERYSVVDRILFSETH